MAATDVDVRFGAEFDEARKALKGFTSDLQSWASNAGGFSGALAGWGVKLAEAALGALRVGLRALKQEISEWIRSSVEAQQVDTRLDLSVQNAGPGLGRTTEELKELAEQLRDVSTFGDEAIKEGERMLIQYQLVGDVLERTTRAAVDMASAMGQDVTSAMAMAGRAVADPERGMLMLRRAGVIFRTEQREMIKTMMEANNVAGAQAVILGELERRFGGAADRMAHTRLGSWQALQEQLGDAREAMGDALGPAIDAVLPVLRAAAEATKEWAMAFSDLMNKDAKSWVTGIQIAVLGLIASVSAGFGVVGREFDLISARAELLKLLSQDLASTVGIGTAPPVADVFAAHQRVTDLENTSMMDLFRKSMKEWMESIKGFQIEGFEGKGGAGGMGGDGMGGGGNFKGGFESAEETFKRIQANRVSSAESNQEKQVHLLGRQVAVAEDAMASNRRMVALLTDINVNLEDGVPARAV